MELLIKETKIMPHLVSMRSIPMVIKVLHSLYFVFKKYRENKADISIEDIASDHLHLQMKEIQPRENLHPVIA